MLDPNQILASGIVANSTMNRGRGLAGVNSYAREFGFHPVSWLTVRRATNGVAAWYDACCGEGRALREASTNAQMTAYGDTIRFYGTDLIDSFPDRKTNVHLIAGDVMTYAPDEPVDLITCVHGLHYLGNKLGFLEHAYRMLAPGGLFAGQLDIANIRILDAEPMTWRTLTGHTKTQKITFSPRRHLLTMEKTDGSLSFGRRYLGATVSETPNYTGITVMDSWYEETDHA